MVRRAIWDTRSPGYNYHIDRCPYPCVSGSLRWGDFCSPQYPGPIARLLCLEPFEEAVGRRALVAVGRVEDENRGVPQHRHQQQPAALDPDREEYPVELLPVFQEVHQVVSQVQGRGLFRWEDDVGGPAFRYHCSDHVHGRRREVVFPDEFLQVLCGEGCYGRLIEEAGVLGSLWGDS